VSSTIRLPPRYAPELTVLGSGGFGTVFRTVDLETGLPVAVKVPHRSGEGELAREVLVELRAAAVLRHPGFIQVLDAGMDADAAPFLVMEFADGGSLDEMILEGVPPWQELAPLLRAVLEALAWAHARGLVHRDIKPDNILLRRGARGRLVPKLADFGLTKVLARRGGYESTRLGAGTILYMPPEAFSGDESGIHPGADLYAFGVVLYRLLSGRYPWDATDIAVLMAKVEGRHRALEPRPELGCPPHVCEVVERLIQPDPLDRYALAADVCADLFGGPAEPAPPPVRPVEGEESLLVARTGPPLQPEPPEPPLLDERPVGRALSVLREPLFVDREDERRRLWELTRRAGSGAVGVALHGRSGVGRSRLCRWLVETLEERGVARTLRVRIDGSRSPGAAVAVGLRRLLLLRKASGEALRSGLAARLTDGAPGDLDALCEWLQPGSSGVGLLDPQQIPILRMALLERLLKREAERGRVCVWLEEERSDPRAAAWAAELFRAATGAGLPLLLLYECAGGSEPHEALAGLERLEVGPLEDTFMAAVLADLAVDLERGSALLTRAGGLPLRAVEAARLLGAAERPRLELDDTVKLAPGDGERDPLAAVASSFSLGRIGEARLDDFCRADPARELSLALLSLLPRPCPDPLLEQAWEAAGGGDRALVRAVIEDARYEGLLRRDEDGAVDFTGVALVEAAGELLDRRPDAADLRITGAETLLAGSAPAVDRRHAAGLLAAAGRPEQALEVLLELGEVLLAGDADGADRIWQDAQRAAEAAGLDARDDRSARIALGAARAALQLADVRQAEDHLDQVDEVTLPPALRASWLVVRTRVQLLHAEPDTARTSAEQAIDLYEEVGDAVGVARARLLVGEALSRSGRREEALQVFERALAQARRADAPRELLWGRWLLARCLRVLGLADRAKQELGAVLELARRHGAASLEGSALRELGNIAIVQGRLEEAEQPFRQSIERLEAAGQRAEAAVTRISLGELARARGGLREARSEYAAALSVTRAYGLVADELAALVNLGITELAMNRGRSAWRRLADLDEALPPGSPHALRVYVEALRTALQTARGRWAEAEDALEGLLEVFRPPGDADVLQLVEETGRRAAEAQEMALAADAWELARRIAAALGDSEALQRIRGRMESAR